MIRQETSLRFKSWIFEKAFEVNVAVMESINTLKMFARRIDWQTSTHRISANRSTSTRFVAEFGQLTFAENPHRIDSCRKVKIFAPSQKRDNWRCFSATFSWKKKTKDELNLFCRFTPLFSGNKLTGILERCGPGAITILSHSRCLWKYCISGLELSFDPIARCK